MKFLFVFFFCLTAKAQEMELPAQSVQSLLIKALHLNLKVKPNNSDQYKIRWTGPLSVKNEEGLLIIQDENFHSKNSWKDFPQKASSKLEIAGPAVPLKVFALDVNISLSYWKESVFISGFKGFLKGSHNTGLWNVHFKEGTLNLNRQKGSLFVRGFHIKSKLKAGQGDFQFYINEGALQAHGFKGRFQFVTDKAKANLKDLKGSLKGSSQSGDLNVSIKPEKVDLFAEEAAIRLYFMGQAPRIRAYTEKGKIYGSNHLHKKFSGKSITVSGRIKGALKKGEVFVQSNIGNIYIN